jgi:hypothetical protein
VKEGLPSYENLLVIPDLHLAIFEDVAAGGDLRAHLGHAVGREDRQVRREGLRQWSSTEEEALEVAEIGPIAEKTAELGRDE